MRLFCLRVVALGFCMVACAANGRAASVFISTEQAGAQVQVDVNHTHHWTWTMPADGDLLGGSFVMKRGPQTSADISLAVFEGTFADYPSASNLLSVTLRPADFTQQFKTILFEGSAAVALDGGSTYTAVLSSRAVDAQNEAYFIKGPSSVTTYVDKDGDPVALGPAGTAVPTPAAGIGGLVLLGGVAAMRGLQRVR